ncbi:hypothetical protein ACQKMN_06220 [Ureibacillus composti]
MYLLMYEIKKQQRMVYRKLQELMKMFDDYSCDCYEEEQILMKDLKRQLFILDKRLKELMDYCECSRTPCHCKCPKPDPDPPTPPVLLAPAYAYAYTTSGGNESGTVRFEIVTPRHDDIELMPEGLKVLRTGLYQISYTATVEAGSATSTASFRIDVNDEIQVQPSIIETTASQHLASTLLFSLLEGDVVKLVADLPEGYRYTNATLQLLQVE